MKKRPESLATPGNLETLRSVKFACEYKVGFAFARVKYHEAGGAARQKSKGSLDFWMNVWTKAMGRFARRGKGFRGLSNQKSKNPKK